MKPDKNPIHPIALLLPWYFMRRLGKSEKERVERHLAACASCKRELKMEYQMYEGVQRAFSSLPESLTQKMEKAKF